MGTIFREEEREKKTEKETEGIKDSYDQIFIEQQPCIRMYQVLSIHFYFSTRIFFSVLSYGSFSILLSLSFFIKDISSMIICYVWKIWLDSHESRITYFPELESLVIAETTIVFATENTHLVTEMQHSDTKVIALRWYH